MRMIEIESTAIKAVGYDPETQRLRVRFPRGVMWEYHEVPPVEYCRLLNADSHGSHFSLRVRKDYVGLKVKEEEPDADQ